MQGNGFRVRAPLAAGRDNDPDDIAVLDGALARLTGRRPAGGDRWRRLRGVQAARGLRPDGTILPGGPTEASLDAGLHALETGDDAPDPARNVPLAASVGRGGVNLPRDVETMRQALDILQPGRAPEDLRDPALSGDPAGLTRILVDVQRAHGLAADGLALPYGPTQTLIGRLVAPRLARLAGPAVDRWHVARPVPGISTAFGVPFGKLDPDEAARATARLLKATIDREAAFAARIAGGDGDDRLAGDDGTDDLAGDTDTAAEAVATGAAVLERFAGDDDDLAEQQRVLDLVRRQTEGRPTAELEHRLRGTLQALRQPRDPHGPAPEGGGDRHTYENRLAALATLLEERYAAEHPDAAPLDARRHVLQKLGAYMGVGAEGLGEMASLVADFTPVVGEVKSLVEGIGDLVSAVETDDPAERRQLMEAAALGFLGAIPFAGKGIKAGQKVVEKIASLFRHGDDTAEQVLKEIDAPAISQHIAKPETRQTLSAEELEEQKYLKEYHELTSNSGKRGRPFSLRNLQNKEPVLAKMTEQELSSWQNRINPAVGSAAEEGLREIMIGGNLITIEDIDKISTAYRFDDGQKRIFDAVTGFDVKETEYPGFYERVIREIDEALAIDVKAGGSRRPRKQTYADRKVNDGYSPDPIKYNGKQAGTKIGATQIINFPIDKIPRHLLEESIMNTLRKGGANDELIEAIPRIIDYYHDIEKSEKETGMTVGALILSVWMSSELITATIKDMSEDGRRSQ